LDVIEFIEKMKRGGFKGAFKTYRNAVGFPRIGAALCHEPCKGVCPGKEQGGAIELLMLEKACIDHAGDRSPTDYNLPGKKKKVAVIGAGISGLACALRLCMKNMRWKSLKLRIGWGAIYGSSWIRNCFLPTSKNNFFMKICHSL
jgi:NADPH-dependent glutamate synthase beta subunit-like oxidoreductase